MKTVDLDYSERILSRVEMMYNINNSNLENKQILISSLLDEIKQLVEGELKPFTLINK